MDELRVQEICEKEHKGYKELCEATFVSNKVIKGGAWAILILGISLIGTGVGWAVTESNTVSRHDVQIIQNTKDISDLQNMSSQMDTVVAIVRSLKK